MSEPKKKRQHFVPKFYLRHFSFDGGDRLHLIHADKLWSIPQAGLKGQCYDDYFYNEKLANDHVREFSKVARMRRADRSTVHEAHPTKLGDNSSLLVSYRAEFPYRPPFSFLSLLRKRRGETGPVSQVEERNPEFSALFDQYQREMKDGLSKRGFLEYYVAHTFARSGVPLPAFIRDPHA